MPAFKIDSFGGMIPAHDDKLLPDKAAALSLNAWLYSGALAGMNAPEAVHTCAGGVGISRVYRIPKSSTDSSHMSNADWLEFTNPDTDVLRATVVGDTFERYYWASSSAQPKYNTRTRIAAGNTGGNAPFLLGIPAPSNAPGVIPAGGSSAITPTRAYVYTWVSAYGEEGPPSPPFVVTGKQDDTWAVTVTAAAAGDLGTNRNLTKVRIYRTVTSSTGVATYFLVVEQAIATTTYNDTLSDTVVSAQSGLQSTTWSAPPTDLKGWVTMPNGIFAGWRNNEIWFCEPYRPHAWPAAYAIVTEFPVVGLGVIGQTLVICTQGSPAWCYGVHPSVMALSKISAFEPCWSRGSIVSAPEGVYYASPNGLIIINYGVAKNITKDLVTKERWQALAPVSTLRAGRLGNAYYGFGGTTQGVFETTAFDTGSFAQVDFAGSVAGIIVDPTDMRVAFTTLSNAVPADMTMTDPWSGEVFVLRLGVVYWIDISNQLPTQEVYTWRSKIFQAPEKKNFAAMRVYFETSSTTPGLNPVRNTNLVQTLASDKWGLIRVYADGVLVTTRELRTSGELMRIASGFKADYWQFEINARVKVFSLQFATSMKELAKI